MRLGALKYIYPIRYMGTKLIADSIHGMFAPRQTHPPRCLDLTRFEAPAHRVRSLAEHQPVFSHSPDRPAAVKRNGGLRGSTATRW